MTGRHTSIDDFDVLHRIFEGVQALLLDFDGPVCSVFTGLPAAAVADQLRQILAEGINSVLPPEVQKSEDPFDIFAYAASLGEVEAHYVEAAMRAHEVEAVPTAEPTPGAHHLMRTWHDSGRKLAIVSNNSIAAVDTYIHLHGLVSAIDLVSARTEPDPALLKPNPHLLNQATDTLNVSASKCVFVGDSLTDFRAAHALEMPVVGYANKVGKAELFAEENLHAIVTDMKFLERVTTLR